MSLLDALELPQASQYRARASQLEAEARMAFDVDLAAELTILAASYFRLSEFAELNQRGPLLDEPTSLRTVDERSPTKACSPVSVLTHSDGF
jgi:hypothetical protein